MEMNEMFSLNIYKKGFSNYETHEKYRLIKATITIDINIQTLFQGITKM